MAAEEVAGNTEAGNQDNGTPVKGSTNIGPLEISWKIDGSGYTNALVTITESTSVIARGELAPGNTDWDTGQHAISDGTVDASFQLQVPTGGQLGQLTVVNMTWTQGGSKNTEQNVDLVNWDSAGNVVG
jgi:hypothetical protein